VIFVDTSAWAALMAARDANHDAARTLFARYADEPFVTTNHVRGETWTFLNRREGHDAAVRFLDLADASPRLEIMFVDVDLEGDALAWLRRRDEREYSFVDATSFALMRRRAISEAFTFDGDFAAAGFVELRP
jgi:predicted nucleic acid-binding protein